MLTPGCSTVIGPSRPASTAMTTFGCAARRGTPMGNIVLVKGVSPMRMAPYYRQLCGSAQILGGTIWPASRIQRFLALYPGPGERSLRFTTVHVDVLAHHLAAGIDRHD